LQYFSWRHCIYFTAGRRQDRSCNFIPNTSWGQTCARFYRNDWLWLAAGRWLCSWTIDWHFWQIHVCLAQRQLSSWFARSR
jgi:hypothetical protein